MDDIKRYSVLIAEDMTPARQLMEKYVSLRNELELIGTAKNGGETLQKLQSRKYDLLLLDIHLPVMSGIEVLEKLKNYPYVIFTTAYDKYAIKAFDIGAIDYMLKPIAVDRFHKAIDRFLDFKKDNIEYKPRLKQYGLSFMEKGKHYFVSFNDIIYLSSHGKHTVIHTEERDFEPASLIKDIEKKLDAEMFHRIHKQYVINMHYVACLEYNQGGKYNITLKDDDESLLPVGRTYAAGFKEKLEL